MAVKHAFRITGGARGIAKRGGGALVEFGPLEIVVLGPNKRLVETEARKGGCGLGAFLDDGLKQQVELDLEAFQRVTGRELTLPEREKFIVEQIQANRWSYLGSGMTHPIFLATLGDLMPEARTQIEQIAPAFC